MRKKARLRDRGKQRPYRSKGKAYGRLMTEIEAGGMVNVTPARSHYF